MIRVSVEVRTGAAYFRAAVLAESIEQALKLAKTRYPGEDARVIFPIEPESFFVDEAVPMREMVHSEAPEEAVG
jgi:hypothetical protein